MTRDRFPRWIFASGYLPAWAGFSLFAVLLRVGRLAFRLAGVALIGIGIAMLVP